LRFKLNAQAESLEWPPPPTVIFAFRFIEEVPKPFYMHEGEL
jgi:hypothetical protein